MAAALGDLQGVPLVAAPTLDVLPRAQLCGACRNPEADEAISAWCEQFQELADRTNAPLEEVERQARLHLPQLGKEAIVSSKGAPERLLRIVESRVASLQKNYQRYFEKSLAGELAGQCGQVAANGEVILIHLEDQRTLSARIDTVSEGIGREIEQHLHYLRAPRHDAIARFGLYIDAATVPICYLSFAPCDREYMRSALSLSLKRRVECEEIVVLARVYGVSRLPLNAISLSIAEASKRLRNERRMFIVTAVNPFLAFDGASMVASGFNPFALSPVAYNYAHDGTYVARRHDNRAHTANSTAPPNMLLVKGMTNRARRELKRIRSIYVITSDLHAEGHMSSNYNSPQAFVTPELVTLRTELERAWNNITRYRGTHVSETDPVSKGQCGVTSAYLAKNLEHQGYRVMFCEGDVFFPGNVPPIRNHCWLRLPDAAPSVDSDKDIIIDMTADQSGYEHPVICDRYGALINQGIRYEQRSEIQPLEVSSDSLLTRLAFLEGRLKALSLQD